MKKQSIIFILFLASLITYTIYGQEYGTWHEIDTLNEARFGHALVELPNGNILVSGESLNGLGNSCEIYNINEKSWRYSAPMNVARGYHAMALLDDGSVLAVGGFQERSCEIYDYLTDTWEMTDSLIEFRTDWETVTKLDDGRVLITGGFRFSPPIYEEWTYLNKCELYDPNQQVWISADSLETERGLHTATLMNDGRVLVAGGYNHNSLELSSCEIYNPVKDQWLPAASMNEDRSGHGAILIKENCVFVTGGGSVFPWTKTVEIYHSLENEWEIAPDMNSYRIVKTEIFNLSSINMLMILGGSASNYDNDTWEIYSLDPLGPVYEEPFPIAQALRDNNNIFQHSDGRIFVIGGEEWLSPSFYIPSNRCWVFDVVTTANDGTTNAVDYELFQNFPNPFNSITTIKYVLPERSNVNLSVFDVLGNRILTLVNQEEESGRHKINFNASTLSSGIYYYRLITEQFSITKKLDLIK